MKRLPTTEQQALLEIPEIEKPVAKNATHRRRAQPRVPPIEYDDLGQHMTPLSIARQMAGLVKRHVTDWKVFDPACGDGNLLLAAVERMEEAGITNIVERVAGVDVDAKMVNMARERIAERLRCKVEEVNVAQQDFLELSSNSLFASCVVPLADFNVVISNPPYGQLREYRFFEASAALFPSDAELVFLMPLAFLDRVNGVESVPLMGRPMGVTTGHAIIHHTAGQPFKVRSVKEHQSNSSAFNVLSGVKLYELGAGCRPRRRRSLKVNRIRVARQSRGGFLVCGRATFTRTPIPWAGSTWTTESTSRIQRNSLAFKGRGSFSAAFQCGTVGSSVQPTSKRRRYALAMCW